MLGDIGEMPHHSGIQKLSQRVVHGLQLQIHQLVCKIGNAAAVEPVGEPVPGLLGRGLQFAPIEKDMALVGMKIESEAAIEQIARRGADIRGR